MRMRRHRRAGSGRPPPVSLAKARRSAALNRSPGNRGRLGGEAIHGVRSHSPIRSKSDHCVPVEALAVIFQRYSIEVMPINRVFEHASAIAPIDFVSMDIEGLDTDVLSEVDFSRFRPALFCVEFNDANARRDIEVLFGRANYKIVREIGCNLFAAPADALSSGAASGN